MQVEAIEILINLFYDFRREVTLKRYGTIKSDEIG
jgi:hypothetical protein